MKKNLLLAAILPVAVLLSGFSLASPDLTIPSRAAAPALAFRQPVDGGRNLFAPAPVPDLIIESITWSPAEPSQSDTVTISVTVKNQGSVQALPSRLNFYVDGNFRSYQDIPSVNAGTTLARNFTWTALAGTHAITVTVDEEDWVDESDNLNNDKTVSIVTLAPDLVIQVVGWSPVTPREGDNVTFTVTVKNQGTGRANDSRVAFYVDDKNTLQLSLEPIEPGETAVGTFNWFAEAGVAALKLVADPYLSIVESDESNNEYPVSFPALVPDLVIQGLTWLPVSPSLGGMVNFTVSVSNWGTARTVPSRLHYYIGEADTGYLDVPSIGPGSTTDLIFTWVAQAGAKDVRVVVDPFNAVTESKEDNNEKTMVFAGAILPDLVIRSLTWPGRELATGETVTFNVTLQNAGTGISPDFNVEYYVDGSRVKTQAFTPLISGGAVITSFSWVVQEGTHLIKAVADAARRVTEADEDNNELTVIYPVSPDLIIPSITWLPEKPETGDNITFMVTLKNQGDGLAGAAGVSQYVDDVYLAFVLTDPLPAGATGNVSFSWVGPAGLHRIGVIADPHDNVLENNEGNNEKKTAFTIYLSTMTANQSENKPATVPRTPSSSSPPGVIDDGNLTPRSSNLILFLAAIPLAGLGVSFYLLLKSRRQE